MQVEDRVIVHRQGRNFERDRLAIGRIIGETKTSWRVRYGDGLGNEASLFRKTDLHLRIGDEYNCTRISPWSDEEWKAYQRELLKMTAARSLSKFNWEGLLVDDIIAIHKQAMEAKRKLQEECT